MQMVPSKNKYPFNANTIDIILTTTKKDTDFFYNTIAPYWPRIERHLWLDPMGQKCRILFGGKTEIVAKTYTLRRHSLGNRG
jgi:hypothetical protein